VAIAFAAAFILVLQTVGGALAFGVGPSPTQIDAFGNPLCITSVDHDHGSTDGEHSKLPQCCTLGCNMFSQSLATASEPTAFILDLPIVSDGFDRTYTHMAFPVRDYDPGNPRAPPLIA
jgi:hypothetical protein